MNNNVNILNGKIEVNDIFKVDFLKVVVSNVDFDGFLDFAIFFFLDDKNRNSSFISFVGNLSDSFIRFFDDGFFNISISGELVEDYRDSLVGMFKV